MHETGDILSQLDGLAFIKSLFPQVGAPDVAGEVRVLCCFHNDSSPSLDYNVKKNAYRCLACGAEGSAVDLWAFFKRVPRHVAVEQLAEAFGVPESKVIAPAVVEQYHVALRQNGALLDVLKRRKGIDLPAVERYRLGWDGEGNRMTIPVRDEHGRCVNLKKYDLLQMHEPKKKYTSMPGHGQQRLWPVEALNGDEVLLVEGELKMIAARMRGINAVTITGGATGWVEAWTPKFAGKRVRIGYDVDQTGRTAAKNRANDLVRVAAEVRVLELPLDKTSLPKGGIEDYFILYTAQDYANLVAATPPWTEQGAILDPALQDEQEYPVELSSAFKAQYYHKRIAVPAIVSAKDIAPYIVPRELGVQCKRGSLDVCQLCPVMTTEIDDRWEIPADKEELLELLDVSRGKQTMRIRELIGIPKECGVAELVTLDSQNVEELRLVPQLNTTDGASPDHACGEQVVAKAYYVGHGLETNAPYELHGRFVAHPEDQHATMLVKEAQANIDSLASFSPTEEQLEELKIFQPQEWTVAGIDAKLDEIYADLERNVTRIYHRRAMHLLYDLVWHSTLYIPLNGEPKKGWLDALVIGDSGCGKSETALRLLQHYGLGEWVDMKSTSVAGLKGGLQETNGRWWVTWGVIPLNDRRMVILDEAKGAPVEVLQALTSMRSSGLAEVQKIERRRAWARTRLLWISNPRSDRKVETYNYGIQAIKELFGSLEDVRRFDVAMVVASNEVTSKRISESEKSDLVKHVFGADLCRRLLLWSWSRGVDSIVFDSNSIDIAQEYAARQGAQYSSSVPLVEGGDQRLKLLRLSAALAGRTFSTVVESRQLIVRPCHVEYAAQFLDQLYGSRFMGYDEFSKIQRTEETLTDVEAVRQHLLRIPNGNDLVQGLARSNEIRHSDLIDWTNMSKDDARELCSFLVRKRGLSRKGFSYYKTGAFIEALRLLMRDLEEGVVKFADREF